MRRTIIVVSVSGMLWVMVASAQGDWPMADGDCRGRSWAENETILQPPLDLVREYPIGGDFISIRGEIMIVCASTIPNTVKAVDLKTGDVLWTFEFPGCNASIGHMAAISDSLVLCGAQSSQFLYALRLKTGEIAWNRTFRHSRYARHTIIDGNTIFVTSDSLFCLNLTDGKTIWRAEHDDTQIVPVVDDMNVYTIRDRKFKKCYAFNKQTGALKWQAENLSKEFLCVDKKYVYISDGNRIVARNKDNGEVVLTFTLPANCVMVYWGTNIAALSDEFLCVALQDTAQKLTQLYALRYSDLAKVWHKTIASEWVPGPLIANGIAYVCAYGYNLLGFDLKTGLEWAIGRYDSYTPPILANHTLYVITKKAVYAFANAGTAVLNEQSAPESFALMQNYPNPFNAETRIRYELPCHCQVKLVVYDLLGNELKELVNENKYSGLHEASFIAGDLPSGVYFYRLTANGMDGKSYRLTKKLMLMK